MGEDINKTNFEVDLSYLNEIAGGSAEFIIDMIDIFLEQTPLYFVQLEEAIKIKDWKTTGDVAHKIKPTLAFMGVEDAKEQMSEIERKARKLDGVEDIEESFASIKVKCELLCSKLTEIREELRAKL